MPPTESRHYRWLCFEFYAERGMVTLIDTAMAADSTADVHKAVQRLAPGDFLKRAMAIRQADSDKYPSETKSFERLFEKAVAVAKIAKAQGDPTDPKVLGHVGRHNRRSSIVLPGEVNSILGPVGGNRFKIPDKPPREIMRSGIQVVPDFTVSAQDVITLQKAEMMRKLWKARR